MSRIIFTGGRDYRDRQVVKAILLHNLTEGDTVVHGACPTGADQLVDEIAKELGYTIEKHPAKWEVHGKGAGPRRNKEMAELGADKCVAFPGDVGTANMVEWAKAAGIPISYVEAP